MASRRGRFKFQAAFIFRFRFGNAMKKPAVVPDRLLRRAIVSLPPTPTTSDDSAILKASNR